MNPSYFYAYYAVAITAIASAPIFLRPPNREVRAYRAFIILLLIGTYLAGMLRQRGVDYGNYERAFYHDSSEIPDLGFRGLLIAFRAVGLPFEAVMLVIAAVTLAALRRASRHFDVSFGLLLTLYFLHAAVTRDFAQTRSGFAIALAICGLTSGGSSRIGLYALAVTMHLTSAPFILAYEFCRMVAATPGHRRQWVLVTGALGAAFALGASIQVLAFVDPRIAIYIAYETENYGLPVGQFLIMAFQIGILVLAYFERQAWADDPQLRALIFLQMLGVAVFFALMSVAVFAYRISSAVSTLYPVVLIALLSRFRLRVSGYSVARMAAAAILIAVGVILVARPGSADIIRSISFD